MKELVLSHIMNPSLEKEVELAFRQGRKEDLILLLELGYATSEQVEAFFGIDYPLRIRWTDTGILPEPVILKGRSYYKISELVAVPASMFSKSRKKKGHDKVV